MKLEKITFVPRYSGLHHKMSVFNPSFTNTVLVRVHRLITGKELLLLLLLRLCSSVSSACFYPLRHIFRL